MAKDGVYRVLKWGQPVGAGATAPSYVTVEGVAKVNSAPDSYTVANEYICGRLALLLGLPAPPGVIVRAQNGSLAYLSLRFDDGARPPPIIGKDLTDDHPHLASGILVFDTWIANNDRHSQNMAYVPGTVDPVIFDHSHALLGSEAGKGIDHLRGIPIDKVFVTKVLAPHVTDDTYLHGWAELVGSVRESVIKAICEVALKAGALTRDERDEAAHFLIRRRDKMDHLEQQIKASLPALTTRGVI